MGNATLSTCWIRPWRKFVLALRQYPYCYRISEYKSCQVGLDPSISCIFQSRRQYFTFRSRTITLSMESICSNHTSIFSPYRFENPSINPFLCCHILWTRSDVTPMYSVARGLLVMMYRHGVFMFLMLLQLPRPGASPLDCGSSPQ